MSRLRRALPLLGVATAIAVACGVQGPPGPSETGPAGGGQGQWTQPSAAKPGESSGMADPGLRAAYIRNRQAAGGADARYHLRAADGGGGAYVAEHATQGYQARIGTAGVSLRLGSDELTLSLRGVACGARLTAAGAARVQVKEHRVELSRPAVSEWYENGPLGLEQGFDLARRPDCTAGAEAAAAEKPVRVELALSGSLQARAEGGGVALYRLADLPVAGHGPRAFRRPALHYGELFASDAEGKPLPTQMELSADGKRLSLVVKDAGARYPLHIDPLAYAEEAILTASNKAANDLLGNAVSLSADGSRAVVGARQADPGALSDAGAAYVYSRNGMGMWTEEAILTASNKAAGDGFGYSVSLSADGSRAVVGARLGDSGGGIDAGAAYVYSRDGLGAWTEEAILSASNKAVGDQLGYSVSLSGDGSRALLGARFSDPGMLAQAGAGYVYSRDGMGAWTEEAILSASNKAAGDNVGFSVSLSGDGSRALLGAPNADPGMVSNAGAAYVYSRNGMGMWSEEAILSASNKAAADQFGFSASLSADASRALVGANTADASMLASAGSGFVYSRNGMGMWTEEAILTASNKAMNDQLGFAVSLSADGRVAVVGVPFSDPSAVSGAGAAYVFREGGKPLGQGCAAGAECASGNCVDGVCCNTTCGGGVGSDCQACSKATGAAVDGTCGAASVGTMCRAQNGDCDVAETCDGSNLTCPANGFASPSTLCRGAAGACDSPENCSGTSAACPADMKRASGTTCRAAAGACDVAETCDGSTNSCPANALRPPGYGCKAGAVGINAACDPADSCDGLRTSCPSSYAPYGTACGTSMSCNGLGRCL